MFSIVGISRRIYELSISVKENDSNILKHVDHEYCSLLKHYCSLQHFYNLEDEKDIIIDYFFNGTGKSAVTRFMGHKNTIVQQCHTGTSLPVGEHFQSAGHSVTDFIFTPVEKITSNNV